MTDIGGVFSGRRERVLVALADDLGTYLSDLLSGRERVDRVSARAKGVQRFVDKASKTENGVPKYTDPLTQIQDQIGARIIVFYLTDVEETSAILERYLRPVETKEMSPESASEFSYFGKHYVCLFPTDLIRPEWARADVPRTFELQIKTLFQHAWSEASHDIAYKPLSGELSIEDRRKLAFASAQAWGADMAFQEIYSRLLSGEALNRAGQQDRADGPHGDDRPVIAELG